MQKKPKTIAQNAVEGMTKGKELTNEAKLSMKRIADRITIIDEIASQTNILALKRSCRSCPCRRTGTGFCGSK